MLSTVVKDTNSDTLTKCVLRILFLQILFTSLMYYISYKIEIIPEPNITEVTLSSQR